MNKFRGDASLLAPAFDFLTARTGVPVLGTVPYLAESLVPAEDSLALDDPVDAGGPAVVEIAVVRTPRIANFDDFEPLAREPGVRVRFARRAADLAEADAIILPGSKSTVADLEWLRARGLAETVQAAARSGRTVIGICGGYQMLGLALDDPDHVESAAGSTAGLGLLPVTTIFSRTKATVRVKARVADAGGPFERASGGAVTAYEIHAGVTRVGPVHRPFVVVERQGRTLTEPDGALSAEGNVAGTYLHGLFANDTLRQAFLVRLAARKGETPDPRWGQTLSASARYDRLADLVGSAIDMPGIGTLVGLDYPRGNGRSA